MEQAEILTHVDHTDLKTTADFAAMKKLIDQAAKYHTASVCIPPYYVKKAKDYAAGKMKICTVIGFPNGYNTTAAKVFETADAVAQGADEIDMVVNRCMVKNGDYSEILEEIRAIKEACDGRILKVIIETCDLSEEEKKILCGIVTEAGADYIKTSTGFGSAGATLPDVELMAKNVGKDVKIKAAGGISGFEDAEAFLRAGADRLGTSRLVKILETK